MKRYRYCVYGVQVVSDMPLALPAYSDGGLRQVECVRAPAAWFAAARERACVASPANSWYHYAFVDDGSTYVRWEGVGEFLIAADGCRIACRRERAASDESFQVYMLGQALSFALVSQRLEPLHATAIVVNGEAVAFLGSNAFGKSSLAACFVQAGCRLLTDDLLIVDTASGGSVAYPGPPRIKLFSKVAARFLGGARGGSPMNRETDKLILPLDEDRSCAEPVALRTIYAVAAPSDACRTPAVRIDTLSPRAAFVELVKGTFNRRLVGARRLECQFDTMARLATRVAVKRLAYPRTIEALQDVRGAVLTDLNGEAA